MNNIYGMGIEQLRAKSKATQEQIKRLCAEPDPSAETDQKLQELMGLFEDIQNRIKALMVAEGDEEDQERAYLKSPAMQRRNNSRGRVGTFSGTTHQRFSVSNAIRSIARGDRLPDYEREVTDRLSRGRDLKPNSFRLPLQERANEIYTTSGGIGAVTYDQDDFLALLRKASIVEPLGIRVRGVGPGVVRIPRETTGISAGWYEEGGSMSNGTFAADYLSYAPMNLWAQACISRTLFASSEYDVESIVRNDMSQAIGEALNAAILSGTGVSGQPMGVLNHPDVDVVALESAPTYAWQDALNLESSVLGNNPPQDATIKVVTSPFGQSKLKATARIGTSYPSFVEEDNRINGYNVVTSNFVPTDLTYSPDSALTCLVGGCWSEAVEVLMWGESAEVVVDPYSGGSEGNVFVYVYLTVNVAVKRPSLLKVQFFK